MKLIHVLGYWMVAVTLLAPVARGGEDAALTNAPPDRLREDARELFRQGEHAAAIDLLQQARKRYEQMLIEQPDSYRLTRNLAMTLFDLGEYDAAQVAFDRALALQRDPEEAPQAGPPSDAAATDGRISVESPAPQAATATASSAMPPTPIRGLEVHPDLLFDSDPLQTADNIAAFVSFATDAGANTVYVHGMTRPDADGAHAETYFPSVQPGMRADLLKPLAERLRPNGIAFHVIMPALSPALPDTQRYRSLRVMQPGLTQVRPSVSWRKRLSPFNTNGLAIMQQLYDELSAHVPLDGIVFGDDTYLTDAEDLNPAAIEAYKEALDIETVDFDALSLTQKATLADVKTEQLNTWCGELMGTVRSNAPAVTFGRTLYPPAAHHPPSKQWLAQDYGDALARYDTVYLLANPELEAVDWGAGDWMTELAETAASAADGPEQTVFAISAFSARRDRWKTKRRLSRAAKRLSGAGVMHIAIGPVDVVVNRPRPEKVRAVFQATP